MEPEEAVKQIQYVTDASLAEAGQRVAPMYRPTFRRVAAEGTGADVGRLADLLTGEIQGGNRPTPEDIDTLAASILRRRRALTDGGRT